MFEFEINIFIKMSSKAAEILLNLNSQVKHTTPSGNSDANISNEKVSGAHKKEEQHHNQREINNI